MTAKMCAQDWKDIAENAQRLAAGWRENFEVLQQALVGNTGASGILVAHQMRKDAERYRWLRAQHTFDEKCIGDFARWFVQAGKEPIPCDPGALDECIDAEMAAAPAVGAA